MMAPSAERKKRLSSTSITDFFARKRPRGAPVVSDEHPVAPAAEPEDPIEDEAVEEKTQDSKVGDKPRRHRDDRDDVLSALRRRELGEFGGRVAHKRHNPRRRLRQAIARWALSCFETSPVRLALSPDWEQRAGRLRNEEFYASCVEFDSHGVLLAAGSSNGVIAIYDFDEYAHRSINIGQRKAMAAREDVGNDKQADRAPLELMHPIHTIFTPFEVQCIKWNPMNEDEIACSFSNRNEIWLFNLSKFPSRPQRVLKSSTHASAGYMSIIFVTKQITVSTSQPRKIQSKTKTELSHVIAGDVSGAIRMWDLRYPNRPVWTISTGPHPINTIVLSDCKKRIICGTQNGYILTYDIYNLSVRAFGTKAMPQRLGVLNVAEMVRVHSPPEQFSAQPLSLPPGGMGVVSLRALQQSATQILCQLRNDWVVVLDLEKSSVVKIFSRFIAPILPRVAKSATPVSVLSTPSALEVAVASARPSPNSWLSCHRCSSTLIFDGSIVCLGMLGSDFLSVIDLNQLAPQAIPASQPDPTDTAAGQPDVIRLDRFRLPTSGPVTAVTGHPKQHIVVCGGVGMELRVLGSFGSS